MFDPLIAFQHYGIKQTGNNRYLSRCPSHEDRSPSLSITTEQDKILLHCHAGCTPQSIVESVGYCLSDLFTEDKEFKEGFHQQKKIQLHETQFITDFQIVKLTECDLSRNKKLSLKNIQTARSSYLRLTKMNEPEKLHDALMEERSFNAQHKNWINKSLGQKYGSF